MKERTLAIAKPDAVENHRIGTIIDYAQTWCGVGFQIVELRMTTFTVAQAEAFYAEHSEKPFFRDLVTFMASGPVVAMVLEKESAVADWREAMRGIRENYADRSVPWRNAVHGSDSAGAAEREIAFFFGIADQPKPIANDKRPVWETVIEGLTASVANTDGQDERTDKEVATLLPLIVEDMRQRDRIGRERYGTPLQPFNGRDALIDAYQEALDGLAYATQAMLERPSELAAELAAGALNLVLVAKTALVRRTLRVFTADHEEFVVAASPEDAAKAFEEDVGETLTSQIGAPEAWAPCTNEHVLGGEDDDGKPVKRTCEQWVMIHGRGYLGSTDA